MFRWTVVLCVFLFAAMYYVGRDHGQVRQGLMESTPPAVAEQAPANTEIAAVAESPAPAAPVPQVQEPADLTAEAAFAPTAPLPEVKGALTVPPEDLLKPGETLGQNLVVRSRGAVVREGPGIQYKLVGRLAQGTPVQEVNQATQLVGWSVVQFTDANGVRKQGFVVTRLLGKP
jgi:hypothetical protein